MPEEPSVKSALGRKAFLLPLLFAGLLAFVGFTSYRALEDALQAELADRLDTLLATQMASLEIWGAENKAIVEVHAADPRVRSAIGDLLRVARRSVEPRPVLLASPALAQLRERLAPALERHGFHGFGVIDSSGMLLAGARDDVVGRRLPELASLVEPLFAGQTRMTSPIRLPVQGLDGVAALVVAAPVRDANGEIVAGFGFTLQPGREFTRLLSVARPGASGETYAFDAQAVMVSRSRFDDQLRAVGLLSEDPSISSSMHVEVRDPGGNLAEGYRPELPLKARPMTRAAARAVAHERGVDVDGYRNYRGVFVAGAWDWLPELEIGVVTEIDVDEAFASLHVLRQRFGLVIGLLFLGALGIFFYTFVVVRLRRQVETARQLGRYRIERKLGSGGMGTVFLARHALLRRPTAIKVLKSDGAGREAIARFEREVQVSSALSHPNTIEIYDFGYTPEGTFYYAMEYLAGVTVSDCVEEDGAQPEGRVLHVWKQVCASIAEAHAAGLIHRDLKPSNVMLCERGGLLDFVKVLDFGLVRTEDQPADLALTAFDSLTGTPLYMPPEVVQSPDAVDARSDVYQLGALAYYMLVGRHVFRGETAYEVLAQHVDAPPERPSAVLGHEVSPELERIVLWCLEKKPDSRPADAGALLEALDACTVAKPWGPADAADWWKRWRERHPMVEPPAEPGDSSSPSGYSVDLAGRLERSS